MFMHACACVVHHNGPRMYLHAATRTRAHTRIMSHTDLRVQIAKQAFTALVRSDAGWALASRVLHVQVRPGLNYTSELRDIAFPAAREDVSYGGPSGNITARAATRHACGGAHNSRPSGLT